MDLTPKDVSVLWVGNYQFY